MRRKMFYEIHIKGLLPDDVYFGRHVKTFCTNMLFPSSGLHKDPLFEKAASSSKRSEPIYKTMRRQITGVQ
jgi:hypothetical protein